MRNQREIILSVLKLTKQGSIQKSLVAQDAHTALLVADQTLRTLSTRGLVQLKEDAITTTPSQRLQLAIETIKHGADAQHTCRFLEWKEFENMAAEAFEINHYRVKRNFHFRANDKRWEIDLLAFKQPTILSVDCKHWQHGWSRGSIQKTVDSQTERTNALGNALEDFSDKLRISQWRQATLVPIVISLIPGAFKFHNNTPIVPVLQLQSFISELPAQIASLTHFTTIMKQNDEKLTEFQQFSRK